MTSVTSNVEDRLAHRTVLVADDNEAVRTAFQVLLSLHGARVLGAASPAEALATVRSQEIDLVIQDMNFRREATTGEEGIALFRELRSQHPDIPVILLTAWTHLETAVDLVKAGAADYVAKPWDDARLLTTVRSWRSGTTCAGSSTKARHYIPLPRWPRRWRTPMCLC